MVLKELNTKEYDGGGKNTFDLFALRPIETYAFWARNVNSKIWPEDWGHIKWPDLMNDQECHAAYYAVRPDNTSTIMPRIRL